MAAVEVTDWDGKGWDSLAGVAARIEERTGERPVIGWEHREVGDRLVHVATINFNSDRCRDSWVHSWVCNAGYVACIV